MGGAPPLPLDFAPQGAKKGHFLPFFGLRGQRKRGPFWPIFGPFLAHFWPILGPFLAILGPFFGPFLATFGPIPLLAPGQAECHRMRIGAASLLAASVMALGWTGRPWEAGRGPSMRGATQLVVDSHIGRERAQVRATRCRQPDQSARPTKAL